MLCITKKVVKDQNGNATQVLIPWEEYQKVEKLMGIHRDNYSLDSFQGLPKTLEQLQATFSKQNKKTK